MSVQARLGQVARPLLVVALSLALALSLYAGTGYDVATVLRGVYDGSVGSQAALEQSFRWAAPLLLIALGVALAFRSGFFNVGAQGQMYVGAVCALAVGLWADGRLPALAVPASLLAGALAGAVWSLIPGVLRLFLGADEVVTSLMLNFVAILILEWATSGPLKSGAGSGQSAVTRPLHPAYRISDASGVSWTILLICVGVVVLTWWFSQRTRTGLEIRVVGRNATVAQWQGVSARRLGLVVFAFSGMTAGLAGGIEAFGPAGSLRAGFSPTVGFMAIVVALVGGLGALSIVVAAAFFGALRAATLFLPVVSGVPQSGIELINGLVALLITSATIPGLRAIRARRRDPRVRRSAHEPAVMDGAAA